MGTIVTKENLLEYTQKLVQSPFVKKIYVTPEMFGASGDGVADDTDALQNMFDSGAECYLLSNSYAISSSVNVSGNICGPGKILAKNSNRISGGLFNVNGNVQIDGITFDCQCSQAFIESDYGNAYNCAIYSVSNGYDIVINRIKCINGYASAFIFLYDITGNITIKDSIFKAEGSNNKWSGYMIYMQTIGGIDNIDIIGNRFYGNGDPTSNFSGIFMSGITTRKKINIGRNFFNGVGRNKTGGHQSHCIDAYWDVSHLNIFENVMINNAYCCLRIHGGTDYDVHDNFFGNVNTLTTDSCVLVQDDKSSTGANPIGVSNVKFRNNVFKTDERYESAIQFSSSDSNLTGQISNVLIHGNDIDGVYNYVLSLDGSVNGAVISSNSFKSTRGGLNLLGGTYAFTSASDITINHNFFEIKGGSSIYNGDASGDIFLKIISNYFRTYSYAVTMKAATSKVAAYNNTVFGTNGFNNVYNVGGNIINASNPANALIGAVLNFGNYINGTLSQ